MAENGCPNLIWHIGDFDSMERLEPTERERVLAAGLSCGVEFISDSEMVDAAKRWAEQLIETGKPIMLQFHKPAMH
jgi:hypothetical protein|tara:strand:- start:106 stop:333 length:228 start_codon:yes stop_codon:yes gene_type:complete